MSFPSISFAYSRSPYSVFSLTFSEGEIGCLSRIVEAGQIDILKHPVVETFLHMKWQMIRKMVYAYIALYTAFLVSFTTLVLIRYIIGHTLPLMVNDILSQPRFWPCHDNWLIKANPMVYYGVLSKT